MSSFFGLGDWDGTDNLFLLWAKPEIPLGQVKAKVFISVLVNLGLFPRDFVSCFP
jgi:hypothetical protein